MLFESVNDLSAGTYLLKVFVGIAQKDLFDFVKKRARGILLQIIELLLCQSYPQIEGRMMVHSILAAVFERNKDIYHLPVVSGDLALEDQAPLHFPEALEQRRPVGQRLIEVRNPTHGGPTNLLVDRLDLVRCCLRRNGRYLGHNATSFH